MKGRSMNQEIAVLDLDSERDARAAAREGKQSPLPIRWRGEVIATLPVELAFEVLAPLQLINSDLTLMLRQAVQVARNNNQASDRWDAAELVIDVLAANPKLPSTVLTVIQQMSTALLGEEGVAKFLAGKPSTGDIAALAKGVFRHYGVSLGEASASSDSSETSGGTSNTTSSDTSTSTPEVSSQPPGQIAS
jgi:hypothetical protein